MKKLIAISLTTVSLLGLGGCAGMNLERENVATVGGAAAGGLVGAALGGPLLTIVGAGAGAYLGDEAVENRR